LCYNINSSRIQTESQAGPRIGYSLTVFAQNEYPPIKALGYCKTLFRLRKALILGIIGSAIQLEERETATEKMGDPHSDANNMRRALIGDCSLLHSSLVIHFLSDIYLYSEEDITVLIDGNPNTVQPTEENIVGAFIFST